VVCAIELNDKSHDREDRKSRDGFLNKVCKDVGLPIVWMKAQNNYNLIEIRQSIRTSIEGAMHATKENPIYNPKEFRKPRT
jgi:tartrate dehydratase alpha subunit/fumarate hydratase class I-like protein